MSRFLEQNTIKMSSFDLTNCLKFSLQEHRVSQFAIAIISNVKSAFRKYLEAFVYLIKLPSRKEIDLQIFLILYKFTRKFQAVSLAKIHE